jgi:hypothetical protein
MRGTNIYNVLQKEPYALLLRVFYEATKLYERDQFAPYARYDGEGFLVSTWDHNTFMWEFTLNSTLVHTSCIWPLPG